jgi:hypothetical protein
VQPVMDCCSECGLVKPIVNRKRMLCDDCNFTRLHHGKTKVEVYKERHDKKEKKKFTQVKESNSLDKIPLVRKTRKAIRKISSKKSVVEKELRIVYRKIDQERDPVCEACGRGDRPLSHSHLLSQYFRHDLITEEENIRLHCFGNYNYCHEKWERGAPVDLIEMNDFKENLEYIREVDRGAYNKIVANFEFNGINVPQ